MWERGQRRNSAACSALACFQSLPTLPTSKSGPSGDDSWVGGFVYILGFLWVSPTNSPVKLGFSPATATPTGFYFQSFWGCSFPCWNPGLRGFSCSPVVLPSLSPCECGTARSASLHLPVLSCHLATPPLPTLPVSTPPTSLNECFFFNSLVVGLPYSLIFWYFWLFFVFKLLFSFFWLCQEVKCIYLHLHLG